MPAGPQLIRDGVLRLIVASHEGEISVQDVEAQGGVLEAVNYTSLSYIRLLDAIENEFGVYLDADEGGEALGTVDGIVTAVLAELGSDAA
ncbi:hypothetical protein [Streptomyces indicus]|uniref:Acyl carrier protein n=1 Tax=Streptomyces indicus TaxID=417292 RepID=A0A1G9AL76_9ACTN|nr:hypothetical protein [Streptomyces indicus]SDK28082.1 hypothetical protein SAMN05421806_10628 [Streptomyces indicus]